MSTTTTKSLIQYYVDYKYDQYQNAPNVKNLKNELSDTRNMCGNNPILIGMYYSMYIFVVFVLCGLFSFILKIWRYEHNSKFFFLALFFVGILFLSYKLEIIF